MRDKRTLAIGVTVSILFTTAAPGEYQPRLGRFLQRDPYATGTTIVRPGEESPCPCGTAVMPFDATAHYGNGMNVYICVGNNPVNLLDPYGTDWLDDLGVDTGAQAWAHATSQISATGGVLFSFADVGNALASGFLSLTGGSGRSWVDNISDCVQGLDPATAIDNTVAWLGAKTALIPFTSTPKWALFYGGDAALAEATGPWGLPASRIAWAARELIGPEGLSAVRTVGAKVAPYATRITVGYGLYLAGVELYCGAKELGKWAGLW